jgi:hypothetical protein
MRFWAGWRRSIGVVIVALLSTGCWSQWRGDPGGSGTSPWPTGISAANVGSLVEGFGASTGSPTEYSDSVAWGGKLFMATAAGLRAYDANGVGNCSGTPRRCQPLWTAAPGTGTYGVVMVQDGKVWTEALSGHVIAYDPTGVQG